ncbi:MAG TPA: phosphoribosylamine--glycine ligase [Actinomycetota bacterium]|nr:phosphoribosylamine--glycine ligase [Actinomycetota bacterium]
MRVLVVGGGGREHALAWALSGSRLVDELVAAPGNAGIQQLARCVPVEPTDIPALVELVEREAIDLTVVGPEAPLVAGLVDELEARGHRAFGPTAAAARIEGSKAWAKRLLRDHGIPAPASEEFTDVTRATMSLDAFDPPYVVKADGLAAGKGVTVAATREEAAAALRASLVEGAFGPAGERVLIEEHLTGREVSALALTDGRTVVPLALAQDFKRALDGDRGPNTGGMGAYSPVPFVDDATEAAVVHDVLEATVRALAAEGVGYRGVLYAGLMLTADGPRVLEFNCRFGDPEAQAVVPRLDADLAEALVATATGDLAGQRVRWRDEACVTVVLASGGYPGPYRTGAPIEGLEEASKLEDVHLFHAGTARRDGRVVTAGGRVLAVSALGKELAAARRRAYRAADLVSFEGKHHRTDIAKEASGG